MTSPDPAPSPAGTQRAVVAADVLVHEEAGEAFLLHVPSGRYYGLNPTGLAVWTALSAGEDPVAALRRRWPSTPEARCREDTEGILGSLADAGLIVLPGVADRP